MARVLVVDDSPTVGASVVWLLADYGHEVRVAQDGLTALGMLHSFNAEVILLDIKLPYIDGLKLLEMIRHNPRYSSTPIVMLSGSKAQEDIQRAIDLGANSYVTKPFVDETLLSAIEQALTAESAGSAL
jgi:CheY-like chemotaxis protein